MAELTVNTDTEQPQERFQVEMTLNDIDMCVEGLELYRNQLLTDAKECPEFFKIWTTLAGMVEDLRVRFVKDYNLEEETAKAMVEIINEADEAGLHDLAAMFKEIAPDVAKLL